MGKNSIPNILGRPNFKLTPEQEEKRKIGMELLERDRKIKKELGLIQKKEEKEERHVERYFVVEEKIIIQARENTKDAMYHFEKKEHEKGANKLKDAVGELKKVTNLSLNADKEIKKIYGQIIESEAKINIEMRESELRPYIKGWKRILYDITQAKKTIIKSHLELQNLEAKIQQLLIIIENNIHEPDYEWMKIGEKLISRLNIFLDQLKQLVSEMEELRAVAFETEEALKD